MDITRAAEIIRSGGLVAFPTETVYGLGANALDAGAVGRIFDAKRRPATSPLIVHVSSREMARGVVSEWPDAAERLATAFWPGPLTLVLPKSPRIPDRVTAGLPTVGVRMPDHPVALALIEAAGVPIAAPSANRFKELSPVTAEHVRQSLGEVGCVLDGGPSQVGIESAVLSLVGSPVLLRPGTIPVERLETVLGASIALASEVREGAHPAPGMHHRHYSPRTPLFLDGVGREGKGVVLRLSGTGGVQMPRSPEAYASALYVTLHRLDDDGLDWIAVEMPPDTPEWLGVRDRLIRASFKET